MEFDSLSPWLIYAIIGSVLALACKDIVSDDYSDEAMHLLQRQSPAPPQSQLLRNVLHVPRNSEEPTSILNVEDMPPTRDAAYFYREPFEQTDLLLATIIAAIVFCSNELD